MSRRLGPNPDELLTSPDYLPLLSQLLVDLDRTLSLPAELHKQLQLAKIAVRHVEDALGALLKEKRAVEERAARALCALQPSDLMNLPEQVREQLRLSPNDHLDLKIVSALDGLGGSATLEKLLIEMWRTQKTMMDRKPLARRLHGLAERGVIFRTPGRRGLYHTTQEAAIRGLSSAAVAKSHTQRERYAD